MQEQQKQAPLPLARQPVSSWDWTVSQSIWKEGGRSGWEWSSLTQEPTAVELASLSQVGGSLDTLAPPSLAQESGACSGRGNLTVAAPSGQRGPAFSTAGWCLFLAQEAALPSGKIEKKKRKRKPQCFFHPASSPEGSWLVLSCLCGHRASLPLAAYSLVPAKLPAVWGR